MFIGLAEEYDADEVRFAAWIRHIDADLLNTDSLGLIGIKGSVSQFMMEIFSSE